MRICSDPEPKERPGDATDPELATAEPAKEKVPGERVGGINLEYSSFCFQDGFSFVGSRPWLGLPKWTSFFEELGRGLALEKQIL